MIVEILIIMRRKILLIFLVTLADCFFISAQGIVLDSSFTTNGKSLTDFNEGYDIATSVKLQNDQKIVVAGFTYNGHDNDYAITRYNSNGSIDTSFGNYGKVITDYQANDERIQSISITSDQKILAAGYAHDNSGISYFCLNRYNSNGNLDVSFGNMGIVVTNVNNNNSRGFNLAIQNDDKIIMVGQCYSGPNSDFAVLRYLPNGALDSTFNATGFSKIDFGAWSDIATSVLVRPNGKIIVSGTNNGSILITRLNSNGTLDSSFATNGKQTLANLSTSNSATTVQPDGKILIAGSYINDIALIRLTENGFLDSTFNANGIAIIDCGNNSLDYGHSLALQNDGKIIVTGRTYANGNYMDIALLRFNPDGSLDSTISITGKITTDFYGYNDEGYATIIQNDGKIIVVGTGVSANSKGNDFAVLRYIDKKIVNDIKLISNNKIKANLFPNPFTDQIVLSSSNSEALTLFLFNSAGHLILQKTVVNSIEINTEKFDNGIYFYKLKSNKEEVKTGKIIKQ